MIRPSGRAGIGFYAGKSPEERRATLPIQRAAIRDGRLPRPTVCSICFFMEGSDPSGKNHVHHHDENYDEPLIAYPICRACHTALHRRFERPRAWSRLIQRHGNGKQWFELLSLDPACQWRPFEESYPAGLPPPFAS